MIVARCNKCNYVARYTSNYFTISELQKHTVSEITIDEQKQCVHDLKYKEDTY